MKKHLYFVTEGRFVRNNDGVYTLGGFPYKLWERYLTVFSKITIVARVSKIVDSIEDSFLSDGDRVSFWDLPYYEGPKDYIRVKRSFKESLRKVVDNIEAENASVICRLPGLIGGEVADLLKKKGRNYACEVVGDPWDVYAPGSMNNVLRPFLRVYFTLKLKKQVSEAKQVLYVTESYLQKRYPAPKACLVTNASNVQIDDNIIKKQKEYCNFDTEIKLLSIGSLDQMYKAPDIVLKAISDLNYRGIICKLVWVGGGRYLDSMKQLATDLGVSKLVSFVGNVDHSKVFGYINETDIYLQVSRTEGLPRALIEAMSQGLVCIGTRVGGIPELLNDQVLIRKNSKEELANCIIKLSKDIAFCNKCSDNNIKQAYKYSETELQKKRMVFYRSVLND